MRGLYKLQQKMKYQPKHDHGTISCSAGKVNSASSTTPEQETFSGSELDSNRDVRHSIVVCMSELSNTVVENCLPQLERKRGTI